MTDVDEQVARDPATDTMGQLVREWLDSDDFTSDGAKPELVETHISWVVLANRFAYKIKKPLRLDFLDFSTAERRRFFCEEEIRLNRAWAPDIYIDVVPLFLQDGHLRLAASGDPVEHAVRMRRFDTKARLDAQLDAEKLTEADMQALGERIADVHAVARRVPATQRGRVLELTQTFMRDNFPPLRGAVDGNELDALRQWTENALRRQIAVLPRRFDDGYFRDCHGDLHLANLVRLPGGITAFDCIEFSEDLRHIDVQCDIAFLVMDLVARHRHDLAAHFLNRYLEKTGDYEGIAVLTLYFVYRCLVRAKIARLREHASNRPDAQQVARKELRFYVDMAKRQAREKCPSLVVMTGLSGSGKTWVSSQLMAALPAIRIRSDIERKRQHGLAETASSASTVGGGIYAESAGAKVYAAMVDQARTVLGSGHHTILDATFLRRRDRAEALALAAEARCRAVIVDVRAARETMLARIATRAGADASEADADVLDYQLRHAEPLTSAEQAVSIVVDNDNGIDIVALAEKLRMPADD